MLKLPRKVGEKIYIGDDIVIEILEIVRWRKAQQQVRLGITAPNDITIDREEIYQIKQEQRSQE